MATRLCFRICQRFVGSPYEIWGFRDCDDEGTFFGEFMTLREADLRLLELCLAQE